jgi:hypothetical protein
MKTVSYGIMAIMLAGCMQNGATQVPVNTTAVSRANIDSGTIALSCTDLASRNQNITLRLRQLEAEQKAQARTNAVTDAVVGVGLTALLGAGAQGGLSGIRAASGAAQGIDAVRRAEQGGGSMAAVSDSIALVQRSSQLQRAMLEKGC